LIYNNAFESINGLKEFIDAGLYFIIAFGLKKIMNIFEMNIKFGSWAFEN